MGDKGAKLNTERNGVVICGAYGHGNAGDDAILEAIVRELRGIDPGMRITVLSRSPAETASKYGINAIHTFDFKGLFRELKSARLYISGGGSLIQDATSRRSLWYYLHSIYSAKKSSCLVCMYGCGIGPVHRRTSRWLAKRTLNSCVDLITLREDHSLAELGHLGVTRPRIVLTSDPALALEPSSEDAADEKMRLEGLSDDKQYICFALRPWKGFTEEKARIFAEAAEYAYSKYGLEAVFVPINHRSDSGAADKAAAHMQTPFHIIREPMEPALCMGVLARMSAVVAMRLHALIFAASGGVPIVGVDYDPKVTAFMKYIGEEGALPFREISREGLCELIDSALSSPVDGLRGNARRLRELESRNVDELRRLLGEE